MKYVEFNGLSNRPNPGSKLERYVDTATGIEYRWTGSAYVTAGCNTDELAPAMVQTNSDGSTSLVWQGGSVLNGLGTTITVGEGGQFATIAEALAYIETQPSTITTYQATGSVALTQYSDTGIFSGGQPHLEVQCNDWLYVPSDAQTLGYSSHYYRVLGVFGEEAGTADSITLETGICTFTGSIASPTFVRLQPYVLLLLPGEHSLSASRDSATRTIIPDGYSIAFVGCGPETVLSGIPMETPAWGLLSFKNIRTTTGTLGGYSKNAFPLISANYPTIYLEDVRYGASYINDPLSGSENEFLYGVYCAGLYVNNFRCEFAHDHGVQMSADRLEVNGFFAETAETGIEPLRITTLVNRPSATKPKILNNISIIRKDGTGSTTGTIGAIFFAVGAHSDTANTWRAYLNGVQVIDSAAYGYSIEVQGGSQAANIFINNGMLESSVVGTEIAASGSGTKVYLHNTQRPVNGNIRSSVTTSAKVMDYNPNATQSVAYAATITPDAAVAQTVIVGTLTGGMTVAAPTNPTLGKKLTFAFTQDATGGRTITWNAIFKKTADAAGAANTKGTTEFVYDGTNWRQVGGQLTWV